MASPPDMSVTSSTPLADDGTLPANDMLARVVSLDADEEVTSSSEMQLLADKCAAAAVAALESADDQAIEGIEDLDNLHATLSPVDGFSLTDLAVNSSSSVDDLFLTELGMPPVCTVNSIPTNDSPFSTVTTCDQSVNDVNSAVLLGSPCPMLSFSPCAAGVITEASLPTNEVGLPDEIDQLLSHATKLSSDVMLSEHSELLGDVPVDLDAFSDLPLSEPRQSSCSLEPEDFVFDDSDWTSVQNWTNLIDEAYFDSLGNQSSETENGSQNSQETDDYSVHVSYIDGDGARKNDDSQEECKRRLRRSVRIQDAELRDLAEKIRQENQLKEKEETVPQCSPPLMSCDVSLERLDILPSVEELPTTAPANTDSGLDKSGTKQKNNEHPNKLEMSAVYNINRDEVSSVKKKRRYHTYSIVPCGDETFNKAVCDLLSPTKLKLKLTKIELNGNESFNVKQIDAQSPELPGQAKKKSSAKPSKKLLAKCKVPTKSKSALSSGQDEQSSVSSAAPENKMDSVDFQVTDTAARATDTKISKNDKEDKGSSNNKSIKCNAGSLQECRTANCSQKVNPSQSVYCSEGCMQQYVIHCAESQSADHGDDHIVMLQRSSGKLVTGSHAPTAASLLSWIKRHPTYEVVQSYPGKKTDSSKSLAKKKKVPTATLR